MEWTFLFECLKKLGFHPNWIKWIQQCVTTVSYSVIVDDEVSGFFLFQAEAYDRMIHYPCIFFLFVWKCLPMHYDPNYIIRKVALTLKSHLVWINYHAFCLLMIASFFAAPTLSRAKSSWVS